MAEEKTWRQIARQTSRKINCGWWLQTLATPLLATSLTIACAILLTRRELEIFPWPYAIGGTLAAIATTATSCWFIARRKFESNKQSLVRLEAAMKMRNALTAADRGIAPWPDIPTRIDDGTRWHWKHLLPPLAGTLVILACGFIIPIQAKSDTPETQQQPTAWSEIDTALDQLDSQEIVQDEYLDEMRKKLEKLREQSPDEWFSHSSLEATDNLKRTHHNEQQNLRKNLQRAERSLNTLQNHASKMNAARKQHLLNEFNQALKQIEQGRMKPNKKLLEQLKNINPQQLKQLTPEQLDQIRENMRKHAQGLGQNPGQQPGKGEDDWMNDHEGEDEGEDGEGEKGGRGGIDRGPGHAPRPLGKHHDDTGAGKHEGLKSDDKRNALPGDLLETTDGKHDIDKTKIGPTAGGTATGKGKGGDRVWKNSLLPNEKKALKKFFQ